MAIKFKNILTSSCGIRYVYSLLGLCSPLTRALLLETHMPVKEDDIKLQYSHLTEFGQITSNESFASVIEKVKIKLSTLKDIRNSVNRLKEGSTADDIELFEIKLLLLVNQEVRDLLKVTAVKSVVLADLSQLLNLLDPEGKRITSFYIYDSYHPQLKVLRKEREDSAEPDPQNEYQISQLENIVRSQLSAKLKEETAALLSSINELAAIDLLIAKCALLTELNLTVPEISSKTTSYKGLFNPQVVELLAAEKKVYQKIDIQLQNSVPLLVTGANMGGKSLTLKTLALAQYMFQFGFGVPAKEAAVVPVEEVFLSSGDDQDFTKGLSSFAAEIKRIDHMIKQIRRGHFILALTDEPASTTNPREGTALAGALLDVLSGLKCMSVTTTHYKLDNKQCHRLRVTGFDEGVMNYSLVADDKEEVPHEAIRIATSLGADEGWINGAENNLKKNK